ncbi:MAG: 4Fe-4S dicluster domain-containing protein [Bdellovibrionales bacterium]|nr:4Fe-4S dicluster domain-containing protein [Bdellovibrionales bacterium]
MNSFIPDIYQINNLEDELIVQSEKKTSEESLKLDVLFVGAGPASLTSAIHLARLAKKQNKNLEIGIIEKADKIGGHTLSGAIINPLIFKWLFPDKKEEDFPFREKVQKEAFYFLTQKKSFPFFMPPEIKSKNYWTASLCEGVRFLAKEAEALGVYLFPSYPADKLIMNENKVLGIVSKPYGLNKDGSKEGNYEESTKIFAKIVVLSEGSRGHLTQAYIDKQKLSGLYPQTYALGVKEIWEVSKNPDKVFHTLGWPLDAKTFGGSWFYPLGNNQVSLGLVVGLDSPLADLSVHDELQKMKEHPLFQKYLKGGKCIEWGAKTIPEGGYHALPKRFSGDGLLIIGDSLGLVNMSSLKGIHYAMASGYYAAQVLWSSFEKQDFSYECLKAYDQKIKESFIGKDLYKYRNLRQSFHKGLFQGFIKAGLITLTKGWFPFDFKQKSLKSDSEIKKSFKSKTYSHQGLSKQDAVYLSGNKSRDKIPSHLIKKEEINKNLALFYESLCPAGVYEQKQEKFIVNSPNCIDCKATDILGPRWTPRERGSGPNYQIM